ncbi:MAG: thymidine phosphorylase [Calditrichaeota bacterium]|nr:thymidine phosphorylase [Calditrichota bacterium]MCB9367756.1 thymidine phosphorylase [Calditrichota bacterium]
MQVSELIARKQDGRELSDSEIDYLMLEFARGTLPDYQMAAMLMAIYFRGVDEREGRRFLDAMIRSGERLSFDSIPRRKVDKHSTGGIGDKTSLIIAPIVAEAGLAVPMISGRALGHTGGTLDKLESIRGMRVTLSHDEFETVLRSQGCAFGAQTETLVPADRKLYALRDVTSTVAIPPLIAASILSKKIAEGTEGLSMDVKIGPGGFLKSEAEARELGARLVDWSRDYGVKTVVHGTDMYEPLGKTAGNAVEVAECLSVLKTGEGDARLIELCELLGGTMLMLGDVCRDLESGKSEFRKLLLSGRGYDRFRRITEAQGADPKVWSEFMSGVPARNLHIVTATDDGTIQEIHPREIGLGLVDLGAGRKTSADPVDHSAGIEFLKRRGDPVSKGEPVANVQWSGSGADSQSAVERITKAFQIGSAPAPARPLVYFKIE